MYSQDVCIAGVGTSEAFGFDLGKSPTRLQLEALSNALADCGLDKSDIDGFATAFGSPRGVDYDQFVLAAGLDCKWVVQMQNHGRWTATNIAQAALAISAGLANCVVLGNTFVGTRKGYGTRLSALGGGHKEGLRDIGGGHGEWDIHGVDTPATATALVATRYMERYHATEEDLGRIAVAMRDHATLNPMAILRDQPLTMSAYLAEPTIAGPFRRSDFCLSSEGSACLILTSRERARNLKRAPVTIAGFEGVKSSRDDHILFARPGLGLGVGREIALRDLPKPTVYEWAAIARESIGGLYLYDAYSSNVWMVLERFGFCGEGEAAAFISSSGIGPKAPLPVNTNGGLIAEAHISGYGHIIEMVRQIRGEAGARQIDGVKAVQWATPWGDSVILS